MTLGLVQDLYFYCNVSNVHNESLNVKQKCAKNYEISISSSHENESGFFEPTLTENEDLPRRAKGAGQHSGLTIALNVESEEYHCSGSESVGFKVSSK